MAHNLGCNKLINWTTDFIKTRLDRLNLMEVWLAGNATSNNDLIGACIPRIASDFERLASNQRFFQHVGVEQFQLLLQSSVYTLGGRSDSDKSTSIVERINPLNGEVTELQPMIGERNYHSAVARDHAILVFGGYNQQSHTILDSCEEFTPATNTSSKYRIDSCLIIQSGKVLVVVCTRMQVEATAPNANAKAHIPGVGEIVVGGCIEIEGGGWLVAENAEIYLTNSSPLGYAGSWCEIASMLNKRYGPSAEFLNGKIYVAGDLAMSTSSVEMLSIFTEGPPQWTDLTETSFRPYSMITFEGSLLFGTDEGKIYELLFNQDDENSSKHEYC
nr:kelch 18 [Hymenolepis microstoma]